MGQDLPVITITIYGKRNVEIKKTNEEETKDLNK